MRQFLPLVLLFVLSACAPVSYSGMLSPEQMEGTASAYNGAAYQARMETAQAAELYYARATQDRATAVLPLQLTQTAIPIGQTQQADWGTQTAVIDAAKSTQDFRTAIATQATATAQMQQTEIATQRTATAYAISNAENTQAAKNWGYVLGGLLCFGSLAIFIFGVFAAFIRWGVPAIDAKFHAWKEEKKVFAKGNTYFVFVPQLGRSVTLPESAAVTSAVINGWSRPAPLQAGNPVRYLEADNSYQEELRRKQTDAKQEPPIIRLVQDAVLVVRADGDNPEDTNVFPGWRDMEKWGEYVDDKFWNSTKWQHCKNILQQAGYIESIPNDKTVVTQKGGGTVWALAGVVIQEYARRQSASVSLPSPTVEYVTF